MAYLKFPNLNGQQIQTYETLSVIENSAQHQANLQAAENEAFEKQKRDAENEKLSEQHRLQREAELRIEAENFRKQSAANFEADLRQRFFDGNPHASESDYLNVKDELKRQALLSNMDFGNKAEEITRGQSDYSPM